MKEIYSKGSSQKGVEKYMHTYKSFKKILVLKQVL